MTESDQSPKSPLLAGLRPGDHYKHRLPPWRYRLREAVLPIIRWETPYLALIQQYVRTPMLDSYFAMTANLGTHTFFVILLPLWFWFGNTEYARGLVHVLCGGVFVTGFMKDMFCLPRPLSPPLHRITMSGSAALEYGFPSTHSANAASGALWSLLYLRGVEGISEKTMTIAYVVASIYAFSIIFGRIYCGMHGFLDIIVGTAVGAALAAIQWVYLKQIDTFLYEGSFAVPVSICLVALFLVRIHPEPADPCPCFDDGVVCVAVIIGISFGNWHFSRSPYSWSNPVPATVPYSYAELGLTKSILRLVLGLFIVFAWREVAKPSLHALLPPIFRAIGRIGVLHNRRDFLKATEYKHVPPLPEESILREVPTLIHNIRRTRSDSVGPQSAADAYETLAYREKRRRESMSGTPASPFTPALPPPVEEKVERAEAEMGRGVGLGEEPEDDAEVFLRIERPRVRYDVEVVTKLCVYGGIALLVVEYIPLLFEVVGLGLAGPAYE